MELLEYALSMYKSYSGKTDAVHVIIFGILLQWSSVFLVAKQHALVGRVLGKKAKPNHDRPAQNYWYQHR
jgi:hypothetical protein